jgi:leucyl aminopeptidase
MKTIVSKSSITTLKTDLVAYLVTPHDAKATLAEVAKATGLSAEQLSHDFKTEELHAAFFYAPSKSFAAGRVIVVGLGDKPSLDALRKAVSLVAGKAREMKLAKVAIDVTTLADYAKHAEEPLDYAAQAIVEGYHHAIYEYDDLKTDRVEAMKKGKKTTDHKKYKAEELVLVADEKHFADIKAGAEVGEVIGTSQTLTRNLQNAPSNYITAVTLAEAAKKSGKTYGFSVTVFDKKKIESLKMGGLLGVNLGSAIPPTFTIMEYKPKAGNSKTQTIALVGKGVTFDTGGISIKPADSMGDMKADMSGAADVIGAVEIAARLKLPVRVIGVIPATDNKTGSNAQNPGDVLTTYSGITVEVDNTDAEGRLILADGLTYVKEVFNPDVIIDLATLTGACVVALGNPVAGLFSNNDNVADKIFKAGLRSGEKVWRLPLWEDYDKQIKSNVADLKNTGGRGAGAITAAKFLEKFIGDHKAWAHLDIAGPAFPGMGGNVAKGGTGFGVRLLTELLRDISNGHHKN